jgi:8-oxo-dGTP diphosphatase
VGVICFRGREVLIIQRGKAPRLGDWSIPGGRLEWNEPVKTCALRELMEETGVRAELLGLVDVIDGFFGEGRHYVLIDYAARWIEGEPVAGDDAADARFMPVAEAIAMVQWEATKQVIRDAWERFGRG